MLLFVPYRARIRLDRLPILTLLVVIACLAIYYFQARNETRVIQSAAGFCQNTVAGTPTFLGQGGSAEMRMRQCLERLLKIHAHTRPQEELNIQVNALRGKSQELQAERLGELYVKFASSAPKFLTSSLWFERPSWHVGRMLTSAFSHSSWAHVTFNLFFFFAFAATVEILLGPVLFIFAFLGIALGHSAIDTLVHLGQTPSPSLGLSGVVAGMMALFIFFVPRARINFFYWVIIKVGTVGIPGWLVGLWFIGGDMYDNIVRTASTTNFIAHLGGAAVGLLIGLLLFRQKRHWAQELVIEGK
jgi:membrane associated rhomboid family serine protease